MTDNNNNSNESNNEEPKRNTAKWVALSLTMVSVLTYSGYYFGKSNSTNTINRLNSKIQQNDQLKELDVIVGDFERLADDIQLSNSERTRLTELLDQVIEHKTKLERTERQLDSAQRRLESIETSHQAKIADLEQQNSALKTLVDEYEQVIEYKKGSAESFTLSVSSSYSLLSEPSSRMSLQKILSNGSVQLYVGNALMFFHIGHTLRFRFAPNWLCDISLTKIDAGNEKAEFEYRCDIN
jgi:uncharacterized coiled-coil protein SlyX